MEFILSLIVIAVLALIYKLLLSAVTGTPLFKERENNKNTKNFKSTKDEMEHQHIKEMFAEGIKVNLDVPVEDTFSETVFAQSESLNAFTNSCIELSKNNCSFDVNKELVNSFAVELKTINNSAMPIAEIENSLYEIFEYIKTCPNALGFIELSGKILKETLIDYKE